jgi:hypothetical protein
VRSHDVFGGRSVRRLVGVTAAVVDLAVWRTTVRLRRATESCIPTISDPTNLQSS